MMQLLATLVADRVDREEGASMVEYSLLIALIVVAVAVAATTLGQGISSLFNTAHS